MFSRLPFSLLVFSAVAHSQFVERRPELGQFQDYEQCYPLKGTWYMTYRTHDAPTLSLEGTAKCVRGHQVGPYENYTTTIRVRHSPNVELDTRLHIKASEGYTHRNVFTMAPVEDPSKPEEFPMVYVDCSSCWVMRHPYVSNRACSVVKRRTTTWERTTWFATSCTLSSVDLRSTSCLTPTAPV
uniref:Putative lipocal-1 1 n=1 Tax=Ixodes ricinus TaxID=34613 RepID=V5HAG6_IXORI